MYVYILWEEHVETLRKLSKDWSRNVKIYKIRKFDPINKDNLIFEEENSKLYV